MGPGDFTPSGAVSQIFLGFVITTLLLFVLSFMKVLTSQSIVQLVLTAQQQVSRQNRNA